VGTARQVVTAFTKMIMIGCMFATKQLITAQGTMVNEITARSLSICITSLRLHFKWFFLLFK
jgi:hypothetical protein